MGSSILESMVVRILSVLCKEFMVKITCIDSVTSCLDVQADGQYIEILYDKDDNIPWKSNSKDLENQGYASSDCIVHDSHGTYNQNCADYTCKPYESIDSLKLTFQLEVSIIRGDPGCSQVVFEFVCFI
jgi:hypothetical protein